jgi:hypothetical protein
MESTSPVDPGRLTGTLSTSPGMLGTLSLPRSSFKTVSIVAVLSVFSALDSGWKSSLAPNSYLEVELR